MSCVVANWRCDQLSKVRCLNTGVEDRIVNADKIRRQMVLDKVSSNHWKQISFCFCFSQFPFTQPRARIFIAKRVLPIQFDRPTEDQKASHHILSQQLPCYRWISVFLTISLYINLYINHLTSKGGLSIWKHLSQLLGRHGNEIEREGNYILMEIARRNRKFIRKRIEKAIWKMMKWYNMWIFVSLNW